MAGPSPAWADVAGGFQPDGSLRDVYVLNADVTLWERAVAYVVGRYADVRFSKPFPGPGQVATLFGTGPDSELTSMSVDVGGAGLACHFFTPDEIELDLDPRQVTGDAALAAVVEFMNGLAAAVGKDVILTHENVRDAVILRCRPAAAAAERR